MNEIYWITRFDSINVLSTATFIITLILSIIIGILYFMINGDVIYNKSRGYDTEEGEGYKKTCTMILRWTIPISFIFCLLMMFIPSTKEALLIYGIGGTVDYIKQNPTAKQLPDKCVKALDKWVDSWNIENEDSIRK